MAGDDYFSSDDDDDDDDDDDATAAAAAAAAAVHRRWTRNFAKILLPRRFFSLHVEAMYKQNRENRMVDTIASLYCKKS